MIKVSIYNPDTILRFPTANCWDFNGGLLEIFTLTAEEDESTDVVLAEIPVQNVRFVERIVQDEENDA